MTVSVIQWATGPVGAAQLREVIDNPEYDLVGVFAYNSTKFGLDAGSLVGRDTTGVRVTGDKSRIVEQPADVVLHAASKSHGAGAGAQNTDDIVTLLESGKNVITTTSYNHLPTYGADAYADRTGLPTRRRTLPRGRRAPRVRLRTPRHHADRPVPAGGPHHRHRTRRLFAHLGAGGCSST
jgi:Dihydrodipicolinate reductase, N-terminus